MLAFIFIFTASSCSKNGDKNPQIDVVNGLTPMDVHDIQWRKDLITRLKSLTPAQRKAEIDKEVPRLNSQLVAYLVSRGKTCPVKNITYGFGSGKADSVESARSPRQNGVFTDQLFAIVKGGKCFGDSLIVFVQCFNGTFALAGDNLETIGTYVPEFTIAKGRGLNNYVDYQTSIWLAEKFNLKLYKSHSWDDTKVISPADARALETKLDSIPVTVRVFAGDHFNLSDMTYNGHK